ncbi:MAG: hypothetical protein ABSC64_07545 [Candidatus Korobacteraceae bacterium]
MIRYALSVAILFFAWIAAAETAAPPVPCPAANNLAGADVVARLMSRNAARTRDLLSFQATRDYQLHYTGFPSSLAAEMQVKVSYTAPGTKQFTIESESGSKLILSRVLHRLLESERESGSDEANRAAVALTTANYTFSLLGCAPGDGPPRYVMQVEPLHASKYLYRGRVWIDATDFAVTRIEVQPAKNPSFWTKRTVIDHEYQKVEGFYLPALNRTVTDVRLGGKAVLTIRYQDYKLSAAENVADPR